MRNSGQTLLRRVHEQVALEVQHEHRALYEFIDPVIRARWEREREDEPLLTLGEIEEFVRSIRNATVEEVQILEAHKVSERHGGRPACLVRVVVGYNEQESPSEFRTAWVRDEGTWYSTALNKSRGPAT